MCWILLAVLWSSKNSHLFCLEAAPACKGLNWACFNLPTRSAGWIIFSTSLLVNISPYRPEFGLFESLSPCKTCSNLGRSFLNDIDMTAWRGSLNPTCPKELARSPKWSTASKSDSILDDGWSRHKIQIALTLIWQIWQIHFNFDAEKIYVCLWS